ncbi:MAG: 16S rRNA (guanine(966)-N(2))-methyltransferase RsmD [Deltaproteobacteria bacterium]|nr:16S rRNA (guanine(966)-N(2))-methyltransferase RsmD [Deltaproteobacteria bacterium]
MRIIGGELRGKKLNSIKGDRTRPTADRVRESIFNILALRIPGAIVLDLFAGTGAMGIEALSRGASSVAFVDCSRDALTVIKKNINACRLDSKTAVFKRDILKSLAGIHPIHPDGFNLVWMDPPYNKNLIEPALSSLEHSGLLQKTAYITIEHSRLEAIPENIKAFEISDQRRYGQTLVSFLAYRADNQNLNT